MKQEYFRMTITAQEIIFNINFIQLMSRQLIIDDTW